MRKEIQKSKKCTRLCERQIQKNKGDEKVEIAQGDENLTLHKAIRK